MYLQKYLVSLTIHFLVQHNVAHRVDNTLAMNALAFGDIGVNCIGLCKHQKVVLVGKTLNDMHYALNLIIIVCLSLFSKVLAKYLSKLLLC